jgi:hypothetical protein
MILIFMISSVNIFAFYRPGKGGKGGHTWTIHKAYVALNFGLLELSSP